MSSHPFVNQGGKRVVRWNRLLLIWLAVISVTLFASCSTGYLLTGDWRYGAFIGLVTGIAFSTVFTVVGLTTPANKLPPIPPRSS